jgi:hypothetical protein
MEKRREGVLKQQPQSRLENTESENSGRRTWSHDMTCHISLSKRYVVSTHMVGNCRTLWRHLGGSRHGGDFKFGVVLEINGLSLSCKRSSRWLLRTPAPRRFWRSGFQAPGRKNSNVLIWAVRSLHFGCLLDPSYSLVQVLSHLARSEDSMFFCLVFSCC